MKKSKVLKNNSQKSNEIIYNAMKRRRSLAYSAIYKSCDIEVKIKVVK